MFDRRTLLRLALAAPALAALPVRAAEGGLRFGPSRPFSYEWLKQEAEARASRPYSEPPRPDPEIVAAIDYDAHGQLKFRAEDALFGDGEAGAYPVTFLHVGQFFPKTVRMYALDGVGEPALAREILYDPAYFMG
ncbi:MAG: glucan biosynthesis protein, partial [Rhodospirillaceae bacterium]|nr:glucan biosynthesis protein [Rhodospirillaceae bacterium]